MKSSKKQLNSNMMVNQGFNLSLYISCDLYFEIFNKLLCLKTNHGKKRVRNKMLMVKAFTKPRVKLSPIRKAYTSLFGHDHLGKTYTSFF